MNFAEWVTLICLPLAVFSDYSQVKSEFKPPVQCTPEIVEVVKVISDVRTLDDLPLPIKEKITTDALGQAFIAWLFIGLIVFAIKSFFFNRSDRRGWQ